jgi:zinc transport system substrate-binding protein
MRVSVFFIVLLMIVVSSCDSQYSKPIYVATSHPIGEILKQVVGTRADVEVLVPPGESPHTFSPKPSDAYKINSARAIFYAAEIMDGWAAKLEGGNKIEMIKFVPEAFLLTFDEMHDHKHEENIDHKHEDSHNHAEHTDQEKSDDDHSDGVVDPHFWTDPVTVKEMLNGLVDTLSVLDPDNAVTYRNNAGIFEKRLDLLARQVGDLLSEVRGKPVFLFHPSFRYLLARYNLVYAGAIETSPGKEPTPKYIEQLVKKINESGAKAIFTEPQLPREPAEVIAEAATVMLFELDPVGGVKGRMTYPDLILYNAKILQKALK